MRKSVTACLAVVLVLAGGMIALLRPRHCPVIKAAFERIEKGMTQAEVHAILGGPAGDYRTRPNRPAIKVRAGSWSSWRLEDWEGDEGTVQVIYRQAGGPEEEVGDALFQDAELHAAGVAELARWRLRKLKGALLP
jgi:hypothetical protein